MHSVLQEPNLVNNMTQERMTRRIRQLEEETLFAEMQASKELDQRRKTPKQKGVSSTTSPEADGTSSVADDLFARAWGGELGRKLCGTAEAHGKTTMTK